MKSYRGYWMGLKERWTSPLDRSFFDVFGRGVHSSFPIPPPVFYAHYFQTLSLSNVFFVKLFLCQTSSLSNRSFSFRYRFSMLLSPSLSRNRQYGKLSVSRCFITQAQHWRWLGQDVLGQAHSFTFEQGIVTPPFRRSSKRFLKFRRRLSRRCGKGL